MLLGIKNLNIGQIWTIKKNEGKVVVLKVDMEQKVVHLSYLVKNQILIYHIPMSFKKFIISVKEVSGVRKVSNKQLSIIKEWEFNEGGVWDLTIDKIIEITM